MLKTGSKIRIRRVWEKMILTASIIEARRGSVGFSQAFDGDSFSPDHGLTALVLTPNVSALAPDLNVQMPWGVGDKDNPGVANVGWKVNGQNINTVWTEGSSADYEFKDEGRELWIYKNVRRDELFDITCDILAHDTRTGVNVGITSEPAKLNCVNKTQAATTMKLSTNIIDYDDMADDYTEWLYRNARGVAQEMTESEARNGSCFIKQVDIVVAKGSKGQQTAGFGLRVTDKVGNVVAQMNATATTATINDPDRILSLTRTLIEVDCRTIQGEIFTIQALDSSNNPIVTAVDSLEVTRSHRDIDTPTVTRRADYESHSTRYHNKVKVSSNGAEITHPEAYLYIEFKTQSYVAGSTERLVGAGNECWFNPNEAGGGLTEEDNGFDMWPEVDYHAVSEVATDENNDNMTDENGDRILI